MTSPAHPAKPCAWVFQPRTLDLDLSVTQNLIYHAALHGIGKQQARARADDVLNRVGLSERTNDKVRNLSGGQMRQVEIARALLHSPGCCCSMSRRLVSTSNQEPVSSATCAGWSKRASRCCGPLTSSTKSCRRIISLSCIIGRVLTHGTAAHIIEGADARDIRSAFIRLTQTMEAGHESS
jgi:ABC-2 type transport system ATP-binding protein